MKSPRSTMISLSTCGNGGAFAEMDGIGRAWAAELKKGRGRGRRPPRHVRNRHAQRGCAGESLGAGGHPHRHRHLFARRGARHRGQPHRQQPRRTFSPSIRRPLPDARGRARMASRRRPRRRRRADRKSGRPPRCSSINKERNRTGGHTCLPPMRLPHHSRTARAGSGASP